MKDKEKQYISMKEMLTKRSFETITNCNCRQYKEGAFVDLLNQEMEELQREKQIDLMVECMFDYARTLVDIKTATEDSRFINCYKDTIRGYANFLYDNNYRKIPENAVVLTREKYELIEAKSTRIPIDKDGNFIEYAIYDTDKVLTKPEYRDYVYNKARKETAKEILSYIGNFYDDCDQRFKLKDYQWHKRLCEKYGVEVEE